MLSVGIEGSSSSVYERKCNNFRDFCKDVSIQEENGILDQSGHDQPTADVIVKKVEYFQYKIVENGCDPGEDVNIRTALSSVYNSKFNRIGVWKVHGDGSTEGSPTNKIVFNKSVAY